MNKKKILYLYREIMPYNVPVLRELVNLGYEITVLHRVKNRKTPYLPPKIENVKFEDESGFSKGALTHLTKKLNPELLFVNDWSVKKYNRCALYVKNELNKPVVVGCDTQWKGGRQWLNIISSAIRHKRYFTHIFVAGVRQFEYAKRLGFKNDQIITNLLSADIETFLQVPILKEKFNGPKHFLYVGRFANAKGLDYLLSAWGKVENKKGSSLTLIGTGPLEDQLKLNKTVNVVPFQDQDSLLEYAKKASCFILPSTFEPWALVIHEFAAAGLPMIVTSECGAAPHFLIPNYNGFSIKTGSSDSIKNAMQKIIDFDSERLYEFSKNSRSISKKINPEIVARSLVSVVE